MKLEFVTHENGQAQGLIVSGDARNLLARITPAREEQSGPGWLIDVIGDPVPTFVREGADPRKMALRLVKGFFLAIAQEAESMMTQEGGQQV